MAYHRDPARSRLRARFSRDSRLLRQPGGFEGLVGALFKELAARVPAEPVDEPRVKPLGVFKIRTGYVVQLDRLAVREGGARLFALDRDVLDGRGCE